MFTRVPIPTPFQVGPVNAYLAGRTVIDPGPDSEEAWDHLVDALDDRDLTPGDLGRVLITHPHPDHFGLASRLREAGATVVASPAAAAVLSDFPARLDYEQSFFQPFFERCGMAASTAVTVTELPETYINYSPSVDVDREVTAGDTVTVDGTTLTVDEVVGHSVGELLFEYEDSGEAVAIVGDTVLPDITPNPFLQPPETTDDERPRVLPAYNDCLTRLREQRYDRLLPGHRQKIERSAARIGAILEEHRERTETVAAIVDGPMTPMTVMEELFGDLPVTEYFPAMSEAVGHLDVLEAQDRAVSREDDDRIVYELTE